MAKNSKNNLKEEWAQAYGRPLSPQEIAEICSGLRRFFGLLRKWNEFEEVIENESGSERGQVLPSRPK
ncbi:MAG TPA: hypothetical protein PL155_08515 [Candidatus Omnitrophota bacterium]|nr:hypothetical protein [Candidatus Omnitrophota bacterium]HPD85503.1 hypothetical protein [Candidatus Omnitrophota bacterium]HRZ03996.1 hypothetical protein [Candidatus Omnitrophota bacterium]